MSAKVWIPQHTENALTAFKPLLPEPAQAPFQGHRMVPFFYEASLCLQRSARVGSSISLAACSGRMRCATSCALPKVAGTAGIV